MAVLDENGVMATRLGTAAPLLGDGSTAPDRRDVSVRYLGGTFVAGALAFVLMGGALWGTAEGQGRLTAHAAPLPAAPPVEIAVRTDRLVKPPAAPSAVENAVVMHVPMLVATADGSAVRPRPFARVALPLDAGHTSERATPRFDPLAVFRPAEADRSTVALGAIYGASVETDIALRHEPFVMPADMPSRSDENDAALAELVALALSPEASHAERQGLTLARASDDPHDPGDVDGARVLASNVSYAEPLDAEDVTAGEQVIHVAGANVDASLTALAGEEGGRFAGALAALQEMAGTKPPETASLKLAFARGADGAEHLVRAGLYEGDTFRAAVAIDDSGRLAPAHRPSGLPPQVIDPVESRPLVLDRSLHDALYQTAYAHDLPDDAAARVAELVASGVDFRADVREGDRVDVLLALPEGANAVGADAELVYVDAVLGDKRSTLYRHTSANGSTGWYDAEGRGARPFLLRNPVPTGRFRSPFGMRRHPIRKRMRMHWGVDWSAPGGTPIMASADGVVKEARWAGGNGRRVVLSHANGYQTSYSHQRRFARGIVPGAKVKQGQIIGYVGTTGLSTGNHLHYELSINGERVDPMRVRLPASDSLSGEELRRFADARARIDALLDPAGPSEG